MLKKLKSLAPYALYVFPGMVLAQGGANIDSVQDGASEFLKIINRYVIPIIFALAFVYFIYGVLKYVSAGADGDKRKEGTGMIVWGIIAIFVMSAVWGLVRIVGNSVGIPTGTNPGSNFIPSVPTTN